MLVHPHTLGQGTLYGHAASIHDDLFLKNTPRNLLELAMIGQQDQQLARFQDLM